MSIFIKQFDTGVNANFASLAIKDTANNFLVGTADTAALTVTIDPDGHVIDQVEYTLAKSNLSLLMVLPVNDLHSIGHQLLFGAKYVDSTHSTPLLIRVDSDGNVIWAKTYGDSNTKMPLEIITSIDSVGEERYSSYIFISKCYSGTDEDVQIIRVDRNGSLEYNTALGFTSTNIQTARLIVYGSGGALIYGGTKVVTGYDSFVATVDKTLAYTSREVFKTSVYHEFRSIIPSFNSGKYIVCGDVGAATGTKQIFAFEMALSTTSVSATGYGFLGGTGFSHLRMISFGASYFLVAYRPTGGCIIVKYSSTLSISGYYDLALDDDYFLSDIIVDTSYEELILDGWTTDGTTTHPLVVRADKNMVTCVTEENSTPKSTKYSFTNLTSFRMPEASYRPTVTDLELNVNHYPIPNHYICPEPASVPIDGSLVQSPYLYMQAAGSDNSDDSSAGMHLRWRFNKSLGDNHFAKGTYANVGSPYYTTIGFNQPDDYVKIYKTPYNTKYEAKVTINNTTIPTEVTTGGKREWHYNSITLTNGGVGTTNIIVRFSDTSQYDTLRAAMGTLQPQTLMQQYTGTVLVGAQNKQTFAARFNVLYNTGSTASAYLRLEGLAYNDPADTTSTFITGRKSFTGPTQLATAGIIGENMVAVRLDFSIAYLSEIILETYEDYITTITTNNLWEFKGDYALTLDTNIAYDRLENNTNPYAPAADKYAVDNAWNKYNDSSAVTGEFKVRVENYQHRWNPVPNTEHPDTDPADGFQAGVQNYLEYSITDTKATTYLPVEDDPGNEAMIEISYFDLLRLATIDYHLARMFGLGMIDADIPDATSPYVYLMVYTSHGALEAGDPSTRVQTHVYMTLPTTEQDYRLPTTPVQDPTTYGISVDNGVGVVNQLTDAQGYVPYDDVRYVDLNREVYNYEKPFGTFFYDSTEFVLANETIPVMYGVDYKASGESVYRKPEITRDPEYFDEAGYNEVMEIPEMGDTQVYIHQEREEGVHCYALYSINWFSRNSPLSNSECTDYTLFRKVKNLIPPSNFAVQLIQPEQPLMFTTADEQTALAAISTSDKTLMRATFDWAHLHNVNYQFAERAQLFYRETGPSAVQGEVLNVYQLPNNQVRVQVTNYMILSTSPSQNVEPLIPSGQESKYIGSLFTTGSTGYTIIAINNTTSPYPEFILDQIKQTSSSDPLNTNQFTTLVTWLQPIVGNRFVAVENLAVDANWSTHLNRTVYFEKFHTNPKITLEATGTANNGTYRIEQVANSGANTNIVVTEDLKSNTVAGNIRYDRVFRLRTINTTSHTFILSGNVAAEFTGITSVHIFGSSYANDGDYTITSATYTFPQTTVTYTGTIPDTDSPFGYLSISKTAAITGINISTHTVTVSGNLETIVVPPYIEPRTNYDGTITKLWYGGIYQPTTVTAINDPVTLAPFGAYDVTFNSYSLPHHIDPSVDWYKGVFRSLDDSATPSFKQLEVWEIKKDSFGVPLSPLQLVVYDPSYLSDTNHIHTGTNVYVNFHPGYRVYLTAEFNGSGNNDSTHQFNKTTMLPATGDGSKVTFIGIRSLDRVKEPPSFTLTEYDSYIAPLVPVLAQEIVAPVAPKDLTGPLFATRPDFYRKSTYTVDIKLNTDDGRKPYGALVYRGSETKVLDVLYKQTTLDTILPLIKQLKVSDTAAYYTMIHDLVNVNVDGSGNFVATTNSLSFSFPLPDNDAYTIPDRNPTVIVHPFSPPTPIIGQAVIDIVTQAILGSFLSLTEQPVIYKYVKGGLTASPKKPIFRNANGDIVVPVLPESVGYNANVYDPHPMAVKFAMTGTTTYLPSDPGYSGASDYYIRFTDFALDGASLEFYFYYACEISNQLVIGPNSPVKAPVLMVNSAPAEPPAIREVISILADPANSIVTSVKFKLAAYNETEGITQFWIYRAYNAADASNIRTMKLARKINVGDPVIDNFSDLLIPPYGEPLFYRIVAVRRIQNEHLAAEDILSLPSNTALTNIVDPFNPAPPPLRSHNGTTTSTELNEVVLTWNPTCYNGTYRLQKLNSSGNWMEIYSTKVKDTPMQYPPLDTTLDFTTYPETDHLQRQDADGKPLYYRYRVEVENSSGLLNLTENELTLAKGAADIQELPSFLGYDDNTGHSLVVLDSTDIITGTSYPDKMHFTLLNIDLPAGHSAFVKVDITVRDSAGGTATKTITTFPGDIFFNNGDGTGLDLDTPNLDYTITTNFYTDFAPNGAVQVYDINYLAGPCYDLAQLTQIVKLYDSAGTRTIDPLVSGNIGGSPPYPTKITITDISNVAAISETFDHLDVTITDSLGATATDTITSDGGGISFNTGDGTGIDLGSPNLSYEISVQLFTTGCSTGTEAVYNIAYSYTPCDDLSALTTIAKYTDGNAHVIDPIANTTVTSYTNPNGSIAIMDEVSSSLPSGHTFDHLDVIVEDDNGGAYVQTATSAGATLTFTDGQGGLDMYTTHRMYYITVILYTNLCTSGTSYVFIITY